MTVASLFVVYFSEMEEKMGVTNFVSEIKRIEKLPEFEKLAHETQASLVSSF